MSRIKVNKNERNWWNKFYLVKLYYKTLESGKTTKTSRKKRRWKNLRNQEAIINQEDVTCKLGNFRFGSNSVKVANYDGMDKIFKTTNQWYFWLAVPKLKVFVKF